MSAGTPKEVLTCRVSADVKVGLEEIAETRGMGATVSRVAEELLAEALARRGGRAGVHRARRARDFRLDGLSPGAARRAAALEARHLSGG